MLRRLGGFPAENVVLLRGDDADAARRALIRLNRLVRREVGGGRPAAMLFVYYSGHADAASLHLGASRLDLRELEELVEGSAAAFRVLVLDVERAEDRTGLALSSFHGCRQMAAFTLVENEPRLDHSISSTASTRASAPPGPRKVKVE